MQLARREEHTSLKVTKPFSAHLFQLFQPKKPILKKVSPKSLFGKYKTQLFGNSCVIYLWRKRARNERSSSGPLCQKSMRVVIYPLDDLGQLPNYPSINHAHVLSSHACSLFLSFHLSALPFALKLTHASHLFSQLCPLRAATSLSMVKVSLFFCHPLNLLPLLLQCAVLCIFFINFICLIWSEKYILKVEFWSTKHQATLICYQKPLGTNTDLFFFFFTYKKNLDLACFVLAKDLFVLLLGTEKILWVHDLELGILVPTPVSLFKSLWIEIWFFKFSMIWVFFGIGYFSFCFRFHIFGIGIGYFSSCGVVQMLGISVGFKYNRAIFSFWGCMTWTYALHV